MSSTNEVCPIPTEDLESFTEKVKDALHPSSSDPNGPIYQSLRKLHAKCLLKSHKEYEAAYNLVEALAPSVRTMATYRADRKLCDSAPKKKLNLISDQLKEIILADERPIDAQSDGLLDYLQKSSCKFEKMIKDNQGDSSDSQMGHLNKDFVKHIMNDEDEMPKMRDRLKELPDEWTLIQLTAGYEPSEQWQNQKYNRSSVKNFHLTVLKNRYLSTESLDPFTVTITPDKVKYGERPVFEELHSTLEENLSIIESNIRVTNNCINKYWQKRADCDLRMKGIISTMDKKWLFAWRCLLMGNILSQEVDRKIRQYIEDASRESKLPLSDMQKMLFYSLIGALDYTTPGEILLYIRKIYLNYSPDYMETKKPCEQCGETKKLNNHCIGCEHAAICRGEHFKMFRRTFMDLMDKIKYAEDMKEMKRDKRGPVILFIDEKLDTFPWEVLPVLSDYPVTRMECLSFAYALFKTHRQDISEGYYQLKPSTGRYVINPDGDLDRMEKRMSTFIEYWCPSWQGDKRAELAPELFQKYLQESDVFLYCGHNDGSQYLGGGAERLEGARAVTTLSGCGSVRLRSPGTRLLPLPVHAHYHIATCPSVVGMLWEVTDLEVDKVTSMLLGLFLPSHSRPHWGDVGKTKWTQGTIDASNVDSNKFKCEPDLLRALTIARRSTAFVMIAASIVARGIPVKIHPDHHTPLVSS